MLFCAIGAEPVAAGREGDGSQQASNALMDSSWAEGRRIAEENESIDFNEEEGILYINNELMVVAKTGTPQASLKLLAKAAGAELDITMADVNIYKLCFEEARSCEELEKLIETTENSEFIEGAFLNYVFRTEDDVLEEHNYNSMLTLPEAEVPAAVQGPSYYAAPFFPSNPSNYTSTYWKNLWKQKWEERWNDNNWGSNVVYPDKGENRWLRECTMC